MNFKSLQCENEPKHQFYAMEGDIHRTDCPLCHGIIRCRRTVKHRPKRRGGKESFNVPHIEDNVLTRVKRDDAIKKAEEARKTRRQDDVQLLRQLAVLDAKFDLSSADFDDSSDMELGDDDLPYLPGETFKPSMRFTASTGLRFAAGQRDFTTIATNGTHAKIQTSPVKNSAIRGNTNAQMGQSAHAASGRGVAKGQGDAFRGDHEEWNHLIADCLGGPTLPSNLVAASAACNSYMLNIESCLRGKGHISITVTANCNAPDVAEWIKYEIFNKGKSLVYQIDATNHYFTREDGEELRKEVLGFCRK